MNVLLVEPECYPPLELLKPGSYHKLEGDEVRLIRGLQCTGTPHLSRARVVVR